MSADIIYPERFHGIDARRISGAEVDAALAMPTSNVVALPAKTDGPNYPIIHGYGLEEAKLCYEDNVRITDNLLKSIERGEASGVLVGIVSCREGSSNVQFFISRGCYRDHFATTSLIEAIRFESMENFMAAYESVEENET